jgi:predicted nucleic acid-binding protein
MSPRPRFVDTEYFIGLVNQRDQLHARAVAFSAARQGSLVTTEPVLLEVGNALGRLPTRYLFDLLVRDLRADPNVEIVPLSPDLFDRAFALYASRPDKEWGMTDCVSFVVMQDREISEALAADQHFVQAGFRALLRD